MRIDIILLMFNEQRKIIHYVTFDMMFQLKMDNAKFLSHVILKPNCIYFEVQYMLLSQLRNPGRDSTNIRDIQHRFSTLRDRLYMLSRLRSLARPVYMPITCCKMLAIVCFPMLQTCSFSLLTGNMPTPS